ncbi:unnamed protein product [Orchesella dallaii]|uniref:Transposable element P transposase-like GTP-binding insertion domain-containing protein n=1 Tax=Orchesella dallaii TaxID=48710 RepID=A0ABP1QQN0_9HEXA
MKTRLCAQGLSHSVATAINFCRKINVDWFKDSEATCEFLDTCDKLFNIFNSRPRNRIENSIENLEFRDLDKPIYQAGKRTFVKGLITSITSLQMIIVDTEDGKIILE